ncbi:HNH endonuclease [Amycolatopsis sp. lyj-109]|uniref:HNH endonuclease n=1 Tax=Amycolatopsis sp. lyj-109 TaxID=2789287 RepID=UPI00397D6DCF
MTSVSRGRGPEVPRSTRNILWRQSIGMCALCKTELATGTGYHAPGPNVAHVVPLGALGPRAESSAPADVVNALANLVLLCPNCHDKVDRNPEHFTKEVLLDLKARHESWAASLRKAGSSWNARFLSVDYVNLPRMLDLPGGESIWDVARELGLDDAKSFTENGARSGAFVRRVRPIFETVDARAVPLDAATVEKVVAGSMVSFEADVRAVARGGALPQAFQFVVGGRQVVVRFDPRWLTTSTAQVEIDTATEEDVRYSGLGIVVGAAEQGLRLSALVFGKPMTDEVALFRAVTSSRTPARDRDEVTLSDYRFRPPKWLADREGVSTPVAHKGDDVLTVALRFDEDAVLPDQIERVTFRALVKTTRTFGRDLIIAVGSELPSVLENAGIPRGRADRYPKMNVAAMAISGFLRADIPALHQVMSGFEPYLELIEVDDELRGDQLLYRECLPSWYRITGDTLFLRRGLSERAEEQPPGWDDLGVFAAVEWDEAYAQEQAARFDPR